MARFLNDRRGSISVLSAIAFCILLACAALIVELSSVYVAKVQQQRTADFALLAAANLPGAISGGAPSSAALATALNVASINGLGSSSVSVTTVNGGTKLNVRIEKSFDLTIGSPYSALKSIFIASMSTATPSSGAGACVSALSSYVGIHGGSLVSGSKCSVVSNTYLWINSSGLDVAKASIGYGSALQQNLVYGATVLNPPLNRFTYNAAISDGLAGEAAIADFKLKLNAMASGWPYSWTAPVTVTYYSAPFGTPASYTSTQAVVAGGARLGTLAIANSTVTFSGSGAADPSCTNPTTVSGATTLSGTSTLSFSNGCYVFQGDVTLTSATTVTFAAAPGAQVRFIFGGALINQLSGTLNFPAATYSIANGVRNQQGGSFNFGAGPKAISGVVDNGWGVSDLGAGPFYFTGATISQGTGTLKFGAGPTYIYSSFVMNGGAGTMTFARGPFYIYGSNIANGDSTPGAAPFMSFAAGPYYIYGSNVIFYANTTTQFGTGDMDFYFSNLMLFGTSVTFGSSATAASGSMRISFAGGSLTHQAGSFIGYGVSIGQTYGLMYLAGGSLSLTAPTSGTPTYGYQNVLMYSIGGSVQLATSAPRNTLGGVIYAPGGSIDSYYRSYAAPASGCLVLMGSNVNFYWGATVNLAPCGNFTGLGGSGSRALLGG